MAILWSCQKSDDFFIYYCGTSISDTTYEELLAETYNLPNAVFKVLPFDGLNGKVRQVISGVDTICFNKSGFREKTGLSDKYDYNKRKYSLDRKDSIIEEKVYALECYWEGGYESFESKEGLLFYSYKTNCDEYCRPIKRFRFCHYTTTYAENGITEIIIPSESSLQWTETWSYDDKGNITEYIQYDSSGDIREQCRMKYSEDGKLKRAEYDNQLLEYEYGTSAKPTGITSRDKSGKIIGHRWIKYDKAGNIIEVAIYDLYGSSTICRYDKSGSRLFHTPVQEDIKYDKAGNWVEKTAVYDSDCIYDLETNKSVNTEKVTREIIYY